MSVIRQSVEVDAPPEEVWSVIADASNLPRWNRRIVAVRDAPNGELKQGDRYTTEIRFMGVTASVRAHVREIHRPRYAEISLSGPVEATVRTYVRPIGRGRSRVEHEIRYRFPGGPVGSLAAKTVEHIGAPAILRRGIRAQKNQVERG